MLTRHRVDPPPNGCEYSRVSVRGEGPDAAAGAASCGFSPVDVAAVRRSCRRAEGVVESPPKDRITLSLAPNARPYRTRGLSALLIDTRSGKPPRSEKTHGEHVENPDDEEVPTRDLDPTFCAVTRPQKSPSSAFLVGRSNSRRKRTHG